MRGAHIAAGAVGPVELAPGTVRREHVAPAAIGIGQLDPSVLLRVSSNQSAVWGAVSAEGAVATSAGAPFAVEARGQGTYVLRWPQPFAATPAVLVSASSFAICYAPPSGTSRHGATVHCRQPGFSLAHDSKHGDGVAAISLSHEDGQAAPSGFSFLAWGAEGRGEVAVE